MSLRCDKCKQEFGSELALTQHLKDKHSVTDPREISNTISKANTISQRLFSALSKKKKLVIASLAIIALLSLIYLSQKTTEVNAQSVDGIQCNSLEGSVMHIHPHLNIIYNGQNLTPPSQVGIGYSCLY